jgi:beta-carotene ketolase (CrtW type)
MHGLVYPRNSQVNHLIGAIAVSLYALFSYEQLSQRHQQHHQYPSTLLDPDFHNGKNQGFLPWYFHFLQGYWNWKRMGLLLLILCSLNLVTDISLLDISCFILLPSFLSSLQLFYFGTFLPHRESKQGDLHSGQVQTTELPAVLSFITCYHFGYHQEHHDNPHLPWWELPTAYRQKRI